MALNAAALENEKRVEHQKHEEYDAAYHHWESQKKKLLKDGLLAYFEAYYKLRHSEAQALNTVLEATRAIDETNNRVNHKAFELEPSPKAVAREAAPPAQVRYPSVE